MADGIATHKMFSLEQLVLHQIAKKLWNILMTSEYFKISESTESLYYSIDLKKYQDNVLNVLELLQTGFPKLLKDKLVTTMINLRLGYSKAYDWAYKYKKIILEIKADKGLYKEYYFERKCQKLLETFFKSPDLGKYEASCFVNPLGHFDDVSWAKIFVNDEKQPLHCRFYLACCYCFEDVINNLWRTMVSKNSLPCENNLPWVMYDSDESDRDLYELWASRLHWEENIDVVEEASFYYDGFVVAFSGYHEHAARFFWKYSSVGDRAEILSELDFHKLAEAAERGYVGFVHFIYSLLPIELKKNLVSFTIREKGSWIFTSMLCSSYYESILSDILILPYSETLKLYEQILISFASIIRKSSIPVHKIIFKVLWNHLLYDDRNFILSSGRLFSFLIEIEDIDLFECVILPLPREMKEKVLLTDWQLGGPTRLSWYFIEDNYEELLCYLLFLFLDCDAINDSIVLRSDSSKFIDRFITCEAYDKWICDNTKYGYGYDIPKFKRIIQDFKETLPVLDQLLNKAKIKDHWISSHDFLSRQIYPLLSLKGNKYKSG